MNRLPGLDLLRAIAIAWVMIFHSYIIGGWGHYGGVEEIGWMGVDLFFVLSGFLIGSQVLKPLAQGQAFSFTDFYLRRGFVVTGRVDDYPRGHQSLWLEKRLQTSTPAADGRGRY